MADIKQDILVVLEKHAKACAIELVSGAVLEEALDLAAASIPGGVDDAIISMLKAPLKAEMLKLLGA